MVYMRIFTLRSAKLWALGNPTRKRRTQPVVKALRHGVTLVELLIVMAVIVLLAGLTLPSVKSMLKDQRISQAARIVQGFAESARARAIANGRRVALVLERARPDAAGGLGSEGLIANDTCVRMSLGEVFPPYEGDWSGTTARIYDELPSGSPDGFADFLEIPASQSASLVGGNALVTAGDVVELADRNQGFVVMAVAGPINSSHTGASVVRIALANPPLATTGSRSNEPVWPISPELSSGAEVSFRIYRKPAKMMAGSVTLPRGTCVDLSVSGVGPSGREFSTRGITPGSVASPAPGDYGAVYIVFGPRGTVEIAYYQNQAISGGNIVRGIVRVLPSGIFHLLVGRTDQVDPGFGTPTAMSAASGREDFEPNVLDSANVWVSMNPYSGMIYSSKVLEGPGGPGAILLARSLATAGAIRQGN